MMNKGGYFTVRRYGRQPRVVTEVQPTYKPESEATAQLFDTVKQGFDMGVKFMRPAVEQEQTVKGEAEALVAFEKGSFEMRRPFSIRDRAFNASGERLVTNRAMIQLEEGFQKALKDADGSIQRLEANLAKLQGEAGSLPEIPGLQTRWLETFERGAATARRQTTELAERRAIARSTAAAGEAVTATELEVARLALTAGTEEELAAAVTNGITEIAKFGPREAFTLNGIEYPADPTRQAIFTASQLQTSSLRLQQEAHELFLRADYERSDSPAQWAAEFEQAVLAGESPLPPDRALTLLGQFESAARADENARRSEEARVERDLIDAAEAKINPYLIAQENGVIAPMPGADRAALRASVAGNPKVAQAVELQLAAADAIAAMAQMGPSERVVYIQNIQNAAVATPGIDPEEAAVINALAPYLKAASAAITRETTGISAAEQLFASGAIPSEADLAAMKTAAAGNPTTAQAYAVLEDALNIIKAGEGFTGDQRKEWLDALEIEVANLAARGGEVGSGATIRLKAIEKALEYFEEIERLAQKDVTTFAARQGIALEPFPSAAEATLADVATVITTRIGQVEQATAQFGNPEPVPVSNSEREAISVWLRETNNSQRMEFMDRIFGGLPTRQATALMATLGIDEPALLAAGRVYNDNPTASRTILASIGVNVSVSPTDKQAAQTVIHPVMEQLSNEDLKIVEDTALAYAKGLAMREGSSAVTTQQLERGYDIAFGADENGRGGLEETDRFGILILPPGRTGDDFDAAIDALARNPERFHELAGGSVKDRLSRSMTSVTVFGLKGEAFGAGGVQGAAVSFIRTPGGGFAPVDEGGGLFLTSDGVLTFTLKELFPDG